MTYHRLEPGQARLLALAVKHDVPARTTAWLEQLDMYRMTDEMRDVFEALAYIPKRPRRSRKDAVEQPQVPADDVSEALLSPPRSLDPVPDVADEDDDSLAALPF